RRTLPSVGGTPGAFEIMTYDVDGNLATKTDFMGRTIGYSYDSNNRLTGKSYPAATNVGFSYTATGRRATMTDARGVTTYEYDARGSKKALSQPNGTVTTYAYDSVGHLTSLETKHMPTGTTIQSYAYTLGPTGIRMRIYEAGGVVRAYGYDALYRLKKETVTG